ncbi:MAG: endonuclease III [Spirochaetales bacterium]|nr:endonuclease III [Spirochaetales bacterium]
MDEHAWDSLFHRFRSALEKQGSLLPSVSLIAKEHGDPFRILIATVVSLRTRDAVTLKASRSLFSRAKTPDEVLELSEEEIQKLIFPAAFYKTKAKTIRAISRMILDEFDGVVPDTQKELMRLPGVGVKTANLTLNLGFGIDAICVDCHVHRIANRLGWIATGTPEESERELMKVMPRRFRIPLNELLVRYGQVICTPVSPFCSRCPEEETCPKVGVARTR